LSAIVILLNIDVDGKVSVDISHLVLVALSHTDDQVVDERLDSSEGGDVLSRAVVDLDVQNLQAIFVLLFGEGKRDCDVREIFCEFTYIDRLSAFFIHTLYEQIVNV